MTRLRASLKTVFILASSLPFSGWRRIKEVFRDALNGNARKRCGPKREVFIAEE